MTDLQVQNLAAVKSFFAAFERKDLMTIAELLADDIILDVPFSNTGAPTPWFVFAGKEEVMKNIAQTFAGFERISYVNPTYTVGEDGSRVFFEAHGDMVTAKGIPYQNVYVHAFTLNQGKIKHFSQYANPITYLKMAGQPMG